MPRNPPYEKTSTHLHWRVTLDPQNTKYQAFVTSYFSEYIMAYETHSNRPHFHAVIEHKGCPKLAFTRLVQNHFPELTGNSCFSVHNLDPSTESLETEREYVCKGDSKDIQPVILQASHYYTPQVIQQLHDKYWVKHLPRYFQEHVEDTPQALQKFITTPKQKTYSWKEKVLDYINEQYPYFDWHYHNDTHREMMLDIVLAKLGEKAMNFDAFMLVKTCNGFFNALDARGFRGDMKSQAKRLWQQQGSSTY